MTKKHIQPTDIIPNEEFIKIRDTYRKKIIDMKKNRRVSLGPDVTFYFENYDTLLWQIQEMVYREKGGEEQIQDELSAYNPLVPQGQELVATVMIEIDDPLRRNTTLNKLGHFERHLVIRFGPHQIHGQPEADMDRTNEQGKTSSVHFIHWPFTPDQITDFVKEGRDVILECTHPHYLQKSIMQDNTRKALIADFDH